MQVNREIMLVVYLGMMMRVVVWFGSFPSFVRMLVMFVVDVQVRVISFRMKVKQLPIILCRPHNKGHDGGHKRQSRQDNKSRGQTKCGAQPTGQRISE